jgi:hypothetical protein
MQTITQRRVSRALGFLLAALIVIPAQLVGSPAVAVANGVPGPIPSVRYDGNGPTSVRLVWDAPLTSGDSAVIDYQIGYREKGGIWSVFEDGLSVARSATVTGLVSGRDYEFRVAAINTAGAGPRTVMGGLLNLQRESTFLCGTDAASQMWCNDYRLYQKSHVVSDYDELQGARRVFDIVSVSNGCFLSKSLGVVCSTDRNLYGELGRGFIGGRGGTFVVPGLPDNVISLSSSFETNCALTSSRDVWCWGRWSYDRYATPILVPTVVLRNVAQLSGFCALLTDTSVSCLKTNSREYQWVNHAFLPPIERLGSGSSGSQCGVAVDGSVVCFQPFQTSGFTVAPGISDARTVLVSERSTCVLRASGAVTCWGDNRNGNLGDGTRTDGTATVRLPEPVIAIATVHTDFYYNTATCATGISTAMYCWGDYRGIALNGTAGPYYMPVEVLSAGTFTARAMEAPGKVAAVTQTGRTARTATVSWSAPRAGDLPITSYSIDWRVGSAEWTTASVPAGTTSWTTPEVAPQSAIDIRVSAVSAAGAGPQSDRFTAMTADPPQRPTAPNIVSNTGNSVTIAWRPTSSPHEPLLGYHIDWSTDRTTWQSRTAAANETSATITGLATGSAVDIRISATNESGRSPYSETITAYTTGLVSHTIAVRDADGQPVYGGQITWRKRDGSFQSALDYGLTVDGRATFPYIPAGPVDVTLRDVQLLGGAIANYETSTVIGFSTASTITLPAEPSASQHVVRVELANGLPVVGATVNVTNLSGSASVDGARFTAPEVVAGGITNEYGEVYLSGYSSDDSRVLVEYNDGVLIQRASGPLGTGDAEFVLEEMPWVETPVVTAEPAAGSLVTLTLKTSGSVSADSRSTRSAVGATVSIAPPAGATQKCKGAKLSATVGANGTATLTVCATKSGRYLIRGKGVVSTGAVSLQVKGAAPLPVVNARAVSPSHGNVTVSWSAPSYSGGNPVTKYTVTLKKGNKTLSKTVTGTSANFSKMPGATKWTVTVVATSKLGSSEPSRMVVPVS